MAQIHLSSTMVTASAVAAPFNLSSSRRIHMGPKPNLEGFVKKRAMLVACINGREYKELEHDNELGLLLGYGRSKVLMDASRKARFGTHFRTPVVDGKGCKVYDGEGQEYLDMCYGIAATVLEDADPDKLMAAVDIATSNLFDSTEEELGRRLVCCSFADNVFLSESGMKANEVAIKLVREYQRNSNPDAKEPATEIIYFTNPLTTKGAPAPHLTGIEHHRPSFRPEVIYLGYGDVEAAKNKITRAKTAAVFVELTYSSTKDFLQFLRNACDDVGALLVFGEVECGLGRTGKLWAHEHYGVLPDIMTLGNPLSRGAERIEFGAVLWTKRIASAINPENYVSTFNFEGRPLICFVANVFLGKISKPDFLANVSEKGEYLRTILKQKLEGNSHVKEIRGLGLITDIELLVPAAPLVEACVDSGLLVLTAGEGNTVIRLMPPLTITEPELDDAVEILDKVLQEREI